MRVVIQKVTQANVRVDGQTVGEIGNGLMVLFAVNANDKLDDLDWLAQKTVNLRIFEDADGVMNRSVIDEGGDILVVSQFTLYAKTKKGNRPSYIDSAKGDVAEPVYLQFVNRLSELLGRKVQTGVFGADMQVSLVNNGPTTIIIDTLNKDL